MSSFEHGGNSYLHWDTNSDAFKQLDIPEVDKEKIINDVNWQAIRLKRDQLIEKTDWTQVSDVQLSIEMVEKYKTYRQKLRDLPQLYSNVNDIDWPALPSD